LIVADLIAFARIDDEVSSRLDRAVVMRPLVKRDVRHARAWVALNVHGTASDVATLGDFLVSVLVTQPD
jgi:hypothetical protein